MEASSWAVNVKHQLKLHVLCYEGHGNTRNFEVTISFIVLCLKVQFINHLHTTMNTA
jgi:hypothetical protein